MALGRFNIFCLFSCLLFAGIVANALLSPPVTAAPYGQSDLSVVHAPDVTGSKNYIYIVNHKSMKLCVYGMKSEKLHLVFCRNLDYDMQVPYDLDSKGKYISSSEMKKIIGNIEKE